MFKFYINKLEKSLTRLCFVLTLTVLLPALKVCGQQSVYPVKLVMGYIKDPYTGYLNQYGTFRSNDIALFATLVDPVEATYSASVRISIEKNFQPIFTTRADVQLPQITLTRGVQVTLDGLALAEYLKEDNLLNGDSKLSYPLTEGTYQIYFELMDPIRKVPVSNKVMKTLDIELFDPPFLTMPEREYKIYPALLNSTMFRWQLNGYKAALGNISYKLEIKEAPKNPTNINDGFDGLAPLFTKTVSQNSYTYTNSDAPLLLNEGSQYLWRVTAIDENFVNNNLDGTVPFRNSGRSEVRSFNVVSDLKEGDKIKVGDFTMTLTKFTIHPVDRTMITGYGEIPVDFLNATIKVSYKNISVVDKELYEGNVAAVIEDNQNIIPPGFKTLEEPLNETDIKDQYYLLADEFFDRNGAQSDRTSLLRSYSLPLAQCLSYKQVADGKIRIGFYAMTFYKNRAEANVFANLMVGKLKDYDIPDHRLIFAGKQQRFNPSGLIDKIGLPRNFENANSPFTFSKKGTTLSAEGNGASLTFGMAFNLPKLVSKEYEYLATGREETSKPFSVEFMVKDDWESGIYPISNDSKSISDSSAQSFGVIDRIFFSEKKSSYIDFNLVSNPEGFKAPLDQGSFIMGLCIPDFSVELLSPFNLNKPESQQHLSKVITHKNVGTDLLIAFDQSIHGNIQLIPDEKLKNAIMGTGAFKSTISLDTLTAQFTERGIPKASILGTINPPGFEEKMNYSGTLNVNGLDQFTCEFNPLPGQKNKYAPFALIYQTDEKAKITASYNVYKQANKTTYRFDPVYSFSGEFTILHDKNELLAHIDNFEAASQFEKAINDTIFLKMIFGNSTLCINPLNAYKDRIQFKYSRNYDDKEYEQNIEQGIFTSKCKDCVLLYSKCQNQPRNGSSYKPEFDDISLKNLDRLLSTYINAYGFLKNLNVDAVQPNPNDPTVWDYSLNIESWLTKIWDGSDKGGLLFSSSARFDNDELKFKKYSFFAADKFEFVCDCKDNCKWIDPATISMHVPATSSAIKVNGFTATVKSINQNGDGLAEVLIPFYGRKFTSKLEGVQVNAKDELIAGQILIQPNETVLKKVDYKDIDADDTTFWSRKVQIIPHENIAAFKKVTQGPDAKYTAEKAIQMPMGFSKQVNEALGLHEDDFFYFSEITINPHGATGKLNYIKQFVGEQYLKYTNTIVIRANGFNAADVKLYALPITVNTESNFLEIGVSKGDKYATAFGLDKLGAKDSNLVNHVQLSCNGFTVSPLQAMYAISPKHALRSNDSIKFLNAKFPDFATGIVEFNSDLNSTLTRIQLSEFYLNNPRTPGLKVQPKKVWFDFSANKTAWTKSTQKPNFKGVDFEEFNLIMPNGISKNDKPLTIKGSGMTYNSSGFNYNIDDNTNTPLEEGKVGKWKSEFSSYKLNISNSLVTTHSFSGKILLPFSTTESDEQQKKEVLPFIANFTSKKSNYSDEDPETGIEFSFKPDDLRNIKISTKFLGLDSYISLGADAFLYSPIEESKDGYEVKNPASELTSYWTVASPSTVIDFGLYLQGDITLNDPDGACEFEVFPGVNSFNVSHLTVRDDYELIKDLKLGSMPASIDEFSFSCNPSGEYVVGAVVELQLSGNKPQKSKKDTSNKNQNTGQNAGTTPDGHTIATTDKPKESDALKRKAEFIESLHKGESVANKEDFSTGTTVGGQDNTQPASNQATSNQPASNQKGQGEEQVESGFEAEADFYLKFKPDDNKKLKFTELGLKAIKASGSVGPASIKGSLVFFDTIQGKNYGKGFKGYGELTLSGAFPVEKAQCAFQFGKTNYTYDLNSGSSTPTYSRIDPYQYFFIDVFVGFKPGLAIGTTSMFLDGLGGGLFYNVKRADLFVANENFPNASLSTADMEREKLKEEARRQAGTLNNLTPAGIKLQEQREKEILEKLEEEQISPMIVGTGLSSERYLPCINTLGIKLSTSGYVTAPEQIKLQRASLLMEFAIDKFALRSLSLDADLGILGKKTDKTIEYAGKGKFSAMWDLGKKTITANGGVHLLLANNLLEIGDEKALVEKNQLEMYMPYGKTDGWYFYLGTAKRRIGGALQLPDPISLRYPVGCYLMMGDNIPSISDNDIQRALQLDDKLWSDLYRAKSTSLPNDGGGKGFRMGQSFGPVQANFKYFILQARVKAGLGYDLSVTNLSNVRCGVNQEPIGMNGWYAQGQAYGYLNLGVDIGIDLLFIHGWYNIFDAHLLAVLKAQAPNPIYFQGYVGGKYSILNGLIDGNFNLSMEIGEQCVKPKPDPVADFPVIASTYPSFESTDKLEIFEPLNASFSLDIGKYTQLNSYNETTKAYEKVTYRPRLYKVGLVESISKEAFLKKTTLQQVEAINSSFINQTPLKTDGTNAPLRKEEAYKAAQFEPKNPLPQNATLLAGFVVTWEKSKDGTAWETITVVNDNGKTETYYEVKIAEFKTGGMPDKIYDQMLSYRMPESKQRNWHKGFGEGMLELKSDQYNDFTTSDRLVKIEGASDDEKAYLASKDWKSSNNVLEKRLKCIYTLDLQNLTDKKQPSIQYILAPGETSSGTRIESEQVTTTISGVLVYNKIVDKEIPFNNPCFRFEKINSESRLIKGHMYKAVFTRTYEGVDLVSTQVTTTKEEKNDKIKSGDDEFSFVKKTQSTRVKQFSFPELQPKVIHEYVFRVSEYANLATKLREAFDGNPGYEMANKTRRDFSHPGHSVIGSILAPQGYQDQLVHFNNIPEGFDLFEQQRIRRNTFVKGRNPFLEDYYSFSINGFDYLNNHNVVRDQDVLPAYSIMKDLSWTAEKPYWSTQTGENSVLSGVSLLEPTINALRDNFFKPALGLQNISQGDVNASVDDGKWEFEVVFSTNNRDVLTADEISSGKAINNTTPSAGYKVYNFDQNRNSSIAIWSKQQRIFQNQKALQCQMLKYHLKKAHHGLDWHDYPSTPGGPSQMLGHDINSPGTRVQSKRTALMMLMMSPEFFPTTGIADTNRQFMAFSRWVALRKKAQILRPNDFFYINQTDIRYLDDPEKPANTIDAWGSLRWTVEINRLLNSPERFCNNSNASRAVSNEPFKFMFTNPFFGRSLLGADLREKSTGNGVSTPSTEGLKDLKWDPPSHIHNNEWRVFWTQRQQYPYFTANEDLYFGSKLTVPMTIQYSYKAENGVEKWVRLSDRVFKGENSTVTSVDKTFNEVYPSNR